MKRHLLLSWEDYVFGVLTLGCLMAHGGSVIFHLYTIGVIILVVSHSYRRGLAVGMVRMFLLSAILIFLHAHHHKLIYPSAVEVLALTGGGLAAGLLGEQQRKTKAALERSFRQIMDVLARSLECRDPYTEGHSRRTAGYAVSLAQEIGLNNEAIALIEQASLLHDLGKIGVPDAVLRKTGSLTPEEVLLMHKHPDEGSQILKDIPSLAKAAELVRHHHEHFDGTGYPGGLRDNSIPLGDRILSVADAYDALTTDRPYRKALHPAAAIQNMQANSGKLFDPHVLEALEKLWQEGKLEASFRSMTSAIEGRP